jgi:uncharacterized membrane protein HdeD (DUF308 family)
LSAPTNKNNKEVHSMLGLVARDWWLYAIRGVAAIVFGIVALVWPGPALTVLVLMFGAYALVDGVTFLVALWRGDTLARSHAWTTGLMGVLGIAIGISTWLWPGITALRGRLLGDQHGNAPALRRDCIPAGDRR